MGQINREFSMVTGKVKNIRFKEKATPDMYGKTHTSMFWVDGVKGEDGKEICFLGGVEDKGRGTRIAAKLDGDWDDLCDGDEVKFAFKQTGTFYNYKAIEITIKGDGKPPAQSSPSSNNSGSTSSSSSGYNANGAAIGQAMNLAVELKICKTYKDMNDLAKVTEAVDQYKKAKELFTAVYEGKVSADNSNDIIDEDDLDVPF